MTPYLKKGFLLHIKPSRTFVDRSAYELAYIAAATTLTTAYDAFVALVSGAPAEAAEREANSFTAAKMHDGFRRRTGNAFQKEVKERVQTPTGRGWSPATG